MGLFADFKNWLFGRQDASIEVAPAAVSWDEPVVKASPPVEKEVQRPVIGVSGSNSSSKSVAAAMSQLRSAGVDPVFIGDHGDRIQKNGGVQKTVNNDLRHFDALMVLGNDGDIDPAKYNAAKDPHTKVETDLARAAYEETAIRQAMDSGMPVLGICGGMQRMNILGGGTLHQHVPDLVGDNHHAQGDNNIAPFVPVQVVKIAQGSMLGKIGGNTHSVYTPTHQELPPGIVMENSFHHQAVKDVRQDFVVNAVSNDGIIEGIEPAPGSRYANQFVMGIQWHPEFGASELGPKIADNFAQAAQAYAQNKEQQTDVAVAGVNQPILPGGAVEAQLLRRQQARTLGLG